MTKKMTFCAMLSVLGIVCLIATNFLQANTIFLYLFSTLFCYIATEEYGVRYGFLTFAVITLVGFLLVANKVSMVAYAIIAGYYPVVKHVIEHWNLTKVWKWLCKIVFTVTVSLVAYSLMKQFLTLGLAFPIVVALGIVLFVIYDMALTAGIRFYVLRLRKFKP